MRSISINTSRRLAAEAKERGHYIGKEGGKMGEALLTVKSLSAWYSNEKMILSDFSFALAEHEVAGF